MVDGVTTVSDHISEAVVGGDIYPINPYYQKTMRNKIFVFSDFACIIIH